MDSSGAIPVLVGSQSLTQLWNDQEYIFHSQQKETDSYGMTRNIYSIVNKKRLSIDYGLAIIIRKMNITENEKNNSSFVKLTVSLSILLVLSVS